MSLNNYIKKPCIIGISIFIKSRADNIQVNKDISLVLPEINFNMVNDNTPNVIPSAMLYVKGIKIMHIKAGIASV